MAMRCAPAVEVSDEVYTPPAVNIASYILVLEYIYSVAVIFPVRLPQLASQRNLVSLAS